jgi:signal transduction histidine kinase
MIYIETNIFMTYYAVVALINGLASTFLGILVYLSKRKDAASLGFIFFSFCASFWSYSYFVWQISSNAASALFWSKMLMAGAIFVPATYLHFVFGLLDRASKNKKFIIFSYLLFSIFLVLDFATPKFIEGVRPILSFKFWPQPGILYHIFLSLWFFYMLVSIIMLFHDYKKSSGIKRNQIKFVLIGIAAALFGATTNFFLWYGIPIPPIGNILVLAYIGFTAYAILKFQLFSIKVIATETFSFLICLVLLINVFLSKSQNQLILNLSIFFAVVFVAILLIKSVLKEVKSKEELAQLTEKLQKANEELKKLDKAKSEFISIASHQLRTPLSIIKGYASMLVEGSYGVLPEKAKDIIQKIGESNERLIHLINDLLDISRMEGGRMKFEWNFIILSELVQSVVEELRPQADKKGLALNWQTLGEKTYVRADEEKLRQVIMNLVDNAIKYTPKGQVDVSIKKIGTDKIRSSVKDTGIGMKKDEMEVLFGKFIRGREVPKVWTEGVGLGLYVAKMIIEEHKGKVWAESEGENKGSTFNVELPVY